MATGLAHRECCKCYGRGCVRCGGWGEMLYRRESLYWSFVFTFSDGVVGAISLQYQDEKPQEAVSKALLEAARLYSDSAAIEWTYGLINRDGSGCVN